MTSKTTTLTGFGFGWSPDDPPHWDPSMSDPIEEQEFLEATPISQRPKVGTCVKTPCSTDQGLAWEYGWIVGWDEDGYLEVRMASDYTTACPIGEVFKATSREFARARARWCDYYDHCMSKDGA